MAGRALRLFEDVVDDIGYIFKRSAGFVLGKSGGHAAGSLAGAAVGTLAGAEGKAVAALTGYTLTAGAVAGVSAAMVQMDFKHQRKNLLERYREEVGALLDKAPDKVNEEDLALIARGDFRKGVPANPTIHKELKNSWLNRNVSMVLAAIATAATFMIVGYVDDTFFHDTGLHAQIDAIKEGLPDKGGITAIMSHIAGGIAENFGAIAKAIGINGLIGLGAYHGIKTPAHWVAAEALGIDEHTVNDHITEIKRTLGHGREVQPEQVLATFVHAHQDIREQIAAEYGKDFDKMGRKQQRELVDVVGQYMNLQQVTEDLNKGRMRPEELAFAAYGQSSGIDLAEDGHHVHHGNIIDGMWKGLSALTGGYTQTANSPEHAAEVTENITQGLPGQSKVTVHTPDEDHAHMHLENEYEEPGRKQSFVARIGRSVDRGEDGKSHVERLEQSSSQNIVITPS